MPKRPLASHSRQQAPTPGRPRRPLRATLRAVLSGTLALAFAAACTSPVRRAQSEIEARQAERAARPASRDQRVVARDPETGLTTMDQNFVVLRGGERLKHGSHRTWYPGGAPETQRSFDMGEPTGLWWSWWPNGLLRSSYEFGGASATPMTWWHENGRLASDGLARNGSRTGPWRFFHATGAPKSEGSFASGRRTGDWVFYDEHGEWTERGRYSSGRRVGKWEYRRTFDAAARARGESEGPAPSVDGAGPLR